MTELPAAVWTYLCRDLIATRLPAYLTLDLDHRLLSWGGETRMYGMTNLQRGEWIGDQVMILNDLLPVEDEKLVLQWVEMQPGCYADIHLFSSDTTIWVVFLNSTREATQYRQLQQRLNELEIYRMSTLKHDQSLCQGEC